MTFPLLAAVLIATAPAPTAVPVPAAATVPTAVRPERSEPASAGERSRRAATPPLTLDEAVRIARANHPDLRAARAGARQADAAADEARAALLPQLGASASYERRASDLGSSRALTTDALGASLSVDQLVWDFGRTTGSARGSRASARAEEASARETELAVVRGVRGAYFEARARRALAAVAGETVAARQGEVERVSALVEVGSRPPSDLARARSDAAQARLEEVRARAAYAVARAALASAMGILAAAPLEVGDDVMAALPGEDGPPEPLVEAAAAARPAVRRLAELVSAQDAAVASARAGWLPRLSVGASAGLSGAEPEELRRGWSAGASLGWSLFDGGATSARVRQAEERRAALVAQADALRQQLRLAVDQALASIEGARAAEAAAADAVAAAAEDLRLAEARYQAGAGTILEVSQARSALASARGGAVQAAWDLSAARADLALAIGEG